MVEINTQWDCLEIWTINLNLQLRGKMLGLDPRGSRFETRTLTWTLQESYAWSQERLSKCLGQKGADLLDLPQHTSDHRPIFITITPATLALDRGFWKFDNAEFVEGCNRMIKSTMKRYSSELQNLEDLHIWWILWSSCMGYLTGVPAWHLLIGS